MSSTILHCVLETLEVKIWAQNSSSQVDGCVSLSRPLRALPVTPSSILPHAPVTLTSHMFLPLKMISSQSLQLLPLLYVLPLMQLTIALWLISVADRWKFYDQEHWSHVSTHLVLVLVVVVVVVVGATYSKKPKIPSFQIRSGWNSAGLFFKRIRVDWRSPIFWCNVIRSKWQPWRHFTSAHRSLLYVQQRPPAARQPAERVWRQFLVHRTVVLVKFVADMSVKFKYSLKIKKTILV